MGQRPSLKKNCLNVGRAYPMENVSGIEGMNCCMDQVHAIGILKIKKWTTCEV